MTSKDIWFVYDKDTNEIIYADENANNADKTARKMGFKNIMLIKKQDRRTNGQLQSKDTI